MAILPSLDADAREITGFPRFPADCPGIVTRPSYSDRRGRRRVPHDGMPPPKTARMAKAARPRPEPRARPAAAKMPARPRARDARPNDAPIARRIRPARRTAIPFCILIDRLPAIICFSRAETAISMHDCRIKGAIYSFLTKTLFPNGVLYDIMRPSYF